ncbi:MAG: hypothetical protein ACK46Q_12795 [Hyphomonas sp.]
MSYEIKDLGNDKFELLRIEPVVIGVLTDRRIAERFADFLTNMEEAERAQMDLFIIEDDVADIDHAAPGVRIDPAPAAPEEILTVADPEPMPGVASEDIPAVPPPAIVQPQDDVQPEAPTAASVKETPMEEAFRRLQAGEALGVVADDIGIPMTRLRSLWAHKCRGMKDRPAQAPTAVAEAPAAEAQCAGCGKNFRLSADGDGLCARCHRDVGRP